MFPYQEFAQGVPPDSQTLREFRFVAHEILLELLNRCAKQKRPVRIILCVLRLDHLCTGRQDLLHPQRLQQRPELVQLAARLPKRKEMPEAIDQRFVIRREDRAFVHPALAGPQPQLG